MVESNMSDLEIQQHVIDELRWDPMLNAAQIGVSVNEGIVHLSGLVSSYSKKWAAEQAVKRVKGVRALVENLEVIIPGFSRKTDDEIAKAALDALKMHSEIPDDSIQVTVENGKVILDGVVDWQFQRKEAEDVIAKFGGVTEVVNKIQINPPLQLEEVKQQIEEAFKRSSIIEANRLKVDVYGSKVILSGTVSSWYECSVAEQAAWSAPGVTEVENKIQIHSKEYDFKFYSDL